MTFKTEVTVKGCKRKMHGELKELKSNREGYHNQLVRGFWDKNVTASGSHSFHTLRPQTSTSPQTWRAEIPGISDRDLGRIWSIHRWRNAAAQFVRFWQSMNLQIQYGVWHFQRSSPHNPSQTEAAIAVAELIQQLVMCIHLSDTEKTVHKSDRRSYLTSWQVKLSALKNL